MHDIYDEGSRLTIADAIKRELSKRGISRKTLVRHDLSISTINKALAGDFSGGTLAKIEAILGTAFSSPVRSSKGEAPKALGAYTFNAVEEFLGNYLFLRQGFSDRDVIVAYLIEIVWDDDDCCLIFREKVRPDIRHLQHGKIFIPFGKPFLNLITIDTGGIRTILLCQPDEAGLARGLIATLHNPNGLSYVPAATPAVLQRIAAGNVPSTGLITQSNPSYKSYSSLLQSVTDDRFAILNSGGPN